MAQKPGQDGGNTEGTAGGRSGVSDPGLEPSLEALATLGRRTAAAAHELNNVLTSILGWAQVALRDPTNGATAESALRTIEANSRRARRILRDALDAARAEGIRHPTLPADVVDDALRLLDWELRRGPVRILRDFQPVPEVNLDRGAVQQILVNLLLNAVQAMPDGGEIRLRVRPEGDGVAFDVADNGPGMSDEVVRHAFDPFFSTKAPGSSETGGSGLGLSIARRLAEAQAGKLSVASTPGSGATFTLWVPLGTATAKELREPVPEDRAARILVVDDEADIRDLLATALGLRGHSVETASDAAAGVSRASDPVISLVLLDYNLPGARGSEVMDRIRERRPDLPILFMSGRTGAESGEHLGLGAAATGWLRKPFDLDEVYREVARLLSAA